MDAARWRYFVVRDRHGALVHAVSYRDVGNPDGEVDPVADDWYNDIKKRFPQDTGFVWALVAMPPNTSPWTHPDELEEALEDPCVSDSWPSNDETAG